MTKVSQHTPGWIIEPLKEWGKMGKAIAISDNKGIIHAFVFTNEDAELISSAPETAAERDRLKEINKELVGALKALQFCIIQDSTGFTYKLCGNVSCALLDANEAIKRAEAEGGPGK